MDVYYGTVQSVGSGAHLTLTRPPIYTPSDTTALRSGPRANRLVPTSEYREALGAEAMSGGRGGAGIRPPARITVRRVAVWVPARLQLRVYAPLRGGEYTSE